MGARARPARAHIIISAPVYVDKKRAEVWAGAEEGNILQLLSTALSELGSNVIMRDKLAEVNDKIYQISHEDDIQFAERLRVAVAALGNDGFMKAPNGKPSKLTPNQWTQVRTPEFRAWFGDWEKDPENASQVMDENGEPRVVYHGTPRGGFKVFGDGSFFTPQEWYAERYVDNGGTEKRYGYDGGTPTMYQVFLNIRKPFDTRNNKERKIFERDFFRKWGNGTPLSEHGLPDWTDADDLLEFLEENELDYDGVVLDEGGDTTLD